MKIRYSAASRDDLRGLRAYLAGEFGAAVADKAIRKIITDISALKDNPGLLRPLADKIHRPTEYDYFLCGRYSIAISLREKNVISVLRILDGRTDYSVEVFGLMTTSARDSRRRGR